MKGSDRTKLRDLSFLSLFTALICIGAYIRVPFAVPVTMQLLFTSTASLTLGRKSALSVLLYLFMGIIGLPVFASGGGASSVFALSFGFNIGFLLGAFVSGAISERASSVKSLAAASAVNVLCVYVCGALYFWLLQNLYFSNPTTISHTLGVCVLPFVLPDIAKCAVSVFLAKRIRSII